MHSNHSQLWKFYEEEKTEYFFRYYFDFDFRYYFDFDFRYYFDGAGKAVRPVIAVCLGKAALRTTGVATNPEVRESNSWIPYSCNLQGTSA